MLVFMGNSKSVSLQSVIKKIENLESRVKRVEKKISVEADNFDDELELVSKKILKEDAKMRSSGKKYLTEEQVKRKYGF